MPLGGDLGAAWGPYIGKVAPKSKLWLSGPFGGHLGPTWDTFGSPVDGHGWVWRPFWRHFRLSGPTWWSKMSEKSDFVILMPLCSEINTSEGPRHQPGALWASKWTLGASSGQSKLASEGAFEPPKAAKVGLKREVLCRSYGNQWNEMETNENRVEIRSARRSKLCKTQDND